MIIVQGYTGTWSPAHTASKREDWAAMQNSHSQACNPPVSSPGAFPTINKAMPLTQLELMFTTMLTA